MVKSKETGNFYVTAKRAFIPSTFDEDVCASLVGTQMPGGIVKEVCEPFNYVVKETGEEITLNHRWVYKSEDELKKLKLGVQKGSTQETYVRDGLKKDDYKALTAVPDLIK